MDSSPQFIATKITQLTGFKLRVRSPGKFSAAMVWAQALPNTTKSSNELAPNRLAPCTDEQDASPHAYKPGTTSSFPFWLVKTFEKIILFY